jgi:hypothetical protein
MRVNPWWRRIFIFETFYQLKKIKALSFCGYFFETLRQPMRLYWLNKFCHSHRMSRLLDGAGVKPLSRAGLGPWYLTGSIVDAFSHWRIS